MTIVTELIVKSDRFDRIHYQSKFACFLTFHVVTKICYFNPLTDLNLKEVATDKDSQTQNDDQQATTSRDPPVIITSGSRDSLPRISTTSQEDQEGHLKLVKSGSSFELSSSISSFASFKSDENIVAVRNMVSSPAESTSNPGATEEGKKVTFSCDIDGFIPSIKRRTTSLNSSGSAVKRTEHTLICSAGSSWFTQSSWDDSLAEDNGNDHGENVSSRLNDENNQSMEVDCDVDKKDSDTGKVRLLSFLAILK